VRARKLHGLAGSVEILLSPTFWRRRFASQRRHGVLGNGVEHGFDLRFGPGIDTEGSIPVSDLDDVESPNWVYGAAYEPIQIASLTDLLDPLAVDYEDTVFLDLGSGKGRAVLMACALPFKRIIGVEFSPSLHRAARQNVERFRGRIREPELVSGDAVAFPIPDDPLVLFLYNPFRAPVMRQVVAHVASSFRVHPRRIVVLYFRPEYAWLFDEAHFLTRVASLTSRQTHGGCHIYDSHPRDVATALA
jgi:SAM-dependent methyltransferase